MKTSSSTFLVILILISSCTSQADKNSKKFVLQGETAGQDSGKLVLSYFSDTTYVSDTANIKNGEFVFSGKIFEPTRANLNGGNDLNRVVVYLEPGKLMINLSKDKFAECKMTGSKTQEEIVFLNKMEKPIYERLAVLREQQFKISDSIKNLKPGLDKLLLEKKSEEIDKQWSQTRAALDSTWLKFVVENPKSFVTPFYLQMLEANEVISLDSLKSIFTGLGKEIQQSKYGKNIIEDIRKKENIRIGVQAPDFKAIDLNQQTVTLSQFKGKSVVLLDFWASWCVPCRESIPHLKTLYKKYHSKGFEVIAVSQDYTRKPWTDAVKQDSTGIWYHIPVAEKWPCRQSQLTNDDIYQNYFVQAIPATIIIDKNGKIIYRHVGYSKESEESLDKQLSEIFDR
jgi:peroxiredoxin